MGSPDLTLLHRAREAAAEVARRLADLETTLSGATPNEETVAALMSVHVGCSGVAADVNAAARIFQTSVSRRVASEAQPQVVEYSPAPLVKLEVPNPIPKGAINAFYSSGESHGENIPLWRLREGLNVRKSDVNDACGFAATNMESSLHSNRLDLVESYLEGVQPGSRLQLFGTFGGHWIPIAWRKNAPGHRLSDVLSTLGQTPQQVAERMYQRQRKRSVSASVMSSRIPLDTVLRHFYSKEGKVQSETVTTAFRGLDLEPRFVAVLPKTAVPLCLGISNLLGGEQRRPSPK
jgi:hypothetical protein